MARTVEQSGECFIRLRPRRLEDDYAVPLQLQCLAPEFVPHDKFEVTRYGNVIRAGIEFNGMGRRVAYWCYRNHPSDKSSLNVGYNQLVRIPAEQMLHIFEPLEPGQLRGVPRLAPVLKRLRSLDNFDDAVLFRQEVANLFAGFVRKPAPDGPPQLDPLTGAPVKLDRDGFTPMVGLEPGTMQELLPGEQVEFSDPPDAGNNYPDFMRQQLMAAAAGSGLPYELMTGDMQGVNDRAIRVVLNEFRRRLEQLQFQVYVHQLCRPVRKAWLDMAVLAGALDLPDYSQRRREYQRTAGCRKGGHTSTLFRTFSRAAWKLPQALRRAAKSACVTVPTLRWSTKRTPPTSPGPRPWASNTAACRPSRMTLMSQARRGRHETVDADPHLQQGTGSADGR